MGAGNSANSLVAYASGGLELLDEIQPLWERLNQHHAAVSPYFASHFQAFRFAERKASLLRKYTGGQLHLDLARVGEQAVGYLVSAVTGDHLGEIESIFVSEPYRGRGIAAELMQRGLAWLEAQDIHDKAVAVAVGNERAFSFYARFGFYPRLVVLKQVRT